MIDWNGGLYSGGIKLFTRQTVTATSASVSASGTLRVAIDATLTGYTPVAVAGIQLINSSFTYYAATISGTDAVVYVKNNGSSAATCKINVLVLYIATAAL